MELDRNDKENIIYWFEAAVAINPHDLTLQDYELAAKIHESLGREIPQYIQVYIDNFSCKQ